METKTTILHYGNFPVESVSEAAGTNVKEGATKFEEDISIDPKIFFVPDDVDITEVKSPH